MDDLLSGAKTAIIVTPAPTANIPPERYVQVRWDSGPTDDVDHRRRRQAEYVVVPASFACPQVGRGYFAGRGPPSVWSGSSHARPATGATI